LGFLSAEPGLSAMKCDICTTDDGEGIHYHAFIDGKHHWVCEACKAKLKVEAEHTDE
jgi:ribosome-binding protein aMBF1 (putative translation factor)